MSNFSMNDIINQKPSDCEPSPDTDIIKTLEEIIISEDVIRYYPPTPRSDFDYHFFGSKNKKYKYINIFVYKKFFGGIKNIHIEINDANKDLSLLKTVSGNKETKAIMDIIEKGKNRIL